MTLRLKFKVLAADGNDFERLITPLLDASLEPGQQAVPGTLTFRTASPIELTGSGQAGWRLTALRQVESVLTQAQVAGAASQLPASQAVQTLMERLG